MAVIALTSAFGLPRRHHHRAGACAVVAAPGAARRGRPDRRLGPAGRLLPWHPGVRRRPDRAGPVRADLPMRCAMCSVRSKATHVSFVAGTRSHSAGRALRDLWAPLAEALADLESTGQDVIVDAGRLGLAGPPSRCSTRPTSPCSSPGPRSRPSARRARGPSVARRDRRWQQSGRPARRRGPALRRPRGRRRSSSLPVLASLADDPEAAAVFSRGAPPPQNFETGAAGAGSASGDRSDPGAHGSQPHRAAEGARHDERTIDQDPADADVAAAVRAAVPTRPAERSPCHRGAEHAGSPSTQSDSNAVDWALVAALRAQASEQLSQPSPADRARLDQTAQEELGRAIVLDLIESAMADARERRARRRGRRPQQDALARAVFDALFRLGRLQPLVDDDRVENIIITGHDNVRLELTDGSLIRRAAGRRLRRGADRLPGLPRLPHRGQRPPVLRGATAAAPAAGRRRPARGGGLGDAAPVGGDPPPPADAGHPRRPGRPATC